MMEREEKKVTLYQSLNNRRGIQDGSMSDKVTPPFHVPRDRDLMQSIVIWDPCILIIVSFMDAHAGSPPDVKHLSSFTN